MVQIFIDFDRSTGVQISQKGSEHYFTEGAGYPTIASRSCNGNVSV